MKYSLYSLLKARFLIEDKDAFKNWRFIVFVIVLAIIMIANTQRFEQKVFEIAKLNGDVKKNYGRHLLIEDAINEVENGIDCIKKMEQRGVYPSTVPPVKVVVKKEVEEHNSLF